MLRGAGAWGYPLPLVRSGEATHAHLEVHLPEEIPEALAKFTLAAELYEKTLVSQGQAAEIAGASRAEFLSMLGRAGRSFTNISPDDLAEELDAWRQLPSRTAHP